jgi:hypothetical protein
VKTWTAILVAGAILALAAPAAYSGANARPHDSRSGTAKIIKEDPLSVIVKVKLRLEQQKKTIASLTAKTRALVAKNRSLAALNRDMAVEISALRAWITVSSGSGGGSSGGSGGGGTSTPPASSGLECVSLVDPAIANDYPFNYDWNC